MTAHALDATASEAMTSQHLFGPFFEGASWNTWRSVVKAAEAEPLDEAELALFRAVAERDPPAQRVRELVCAVGRGGGKDSIASFLAAYLAVTFDPKGKLRPGERGSVHRRRQGASGNLLPLHRWLFRAHSGAGSDGN